MPIETRHNCPRAGCPTPVRQTRFACNAHWRKIPKPLQDAIYEGVAAGPLSPAHAAAMLDAMEWLNDPGNDDIVDPVRLPR